MPRINFKSSTMEPLPNDTYLLSVDSMEIKTSGPRAKNPGSHYIETVFSVKAGEHAGRKVYHNLSLLPQAGWKLVEFLDACGVPYDSVPGAGKGEFDVSFNTEDCIGQEPLAEIAQETYKTNSGADEIRSVINKFVAKRD